MKLAIKALVVIVAMAGSSAQARTQPEPITAEGLETAKQAVAAKPDDVDARLRYSSMLRAVFRFGEASEVMQQAAAKAPDDPRVWLELARLAALSGNRGAAGSHAQKAMRLGDDSGEAKELVERLSAAVRILTRKAVKLPEDSSARAIVPVFAALKDGKLEEAAKGVVAPEWTNGALAAHIGAYGRYLRQVAGVDWAGYELAPLEGDRARVRLLWKVEPARLDFEATSELPAPYRQLLPLEWASGLARVGDPALRAEAIDAARKATWTDVTLATAIVEDGKIAALMVGDQDLLQVRLPKVSVGAPAADGEKVGAALSPEEKKLRREMFKSRYGKSEPAEDGAYRYRQILFGLAISAVMALFMVWLVRREKRKGKGRR